MLLSGCTKRSTIWHTFLHSFFIFPVKGCMAYAQYLCRFAGWKFSSFTLPTDSFKLLWHLNRWPAKFPSVLFCGCNSLCLPLTNEFAFCLRNVRKNLKNQIRNQGSRQIPSFLPRIEKFHIKHQNVCSDFFCNVLPLAQNIIIIPSQPVDAFYDQQISCP